MTYLMCDTQKGLRGFEKILNSDFLLQVQPVACVPESAPRTGPAFPLKQGQFLFRCQMIHRTSQVQPAAGVPEAHGRLGPLPDGAVGQRTQPRLRHPQRLPVHAAVGRLEVAASACLSRLSSLHQIECCRSRSKLCEHLAESRLHQIECCRSRSKLRAWGRSNGLRMTPRHRFFSHGFSQRPLNNPLTAHKPLAPGTRPATSGGRRPRLRGASRHPRCRTSFRSSWTTPQVMPPQIRGQQVQGTSKSKADKTEADKTEDGMGPAATSLSHIIRCSWTPPQAGCLRVHSLGLQFPFPLVCLLSSARCRPRRYHVGLRDLYQRQDRGAGHQIELQGSRLACQGLRLTASRELRSCIAAALPRF